MLNAHCYGSTRQAGRRARGRPAAALHASRPMQMCFSPATCRPVQVQQLWLFVAGTHSLSDKQLEEEGLTSRGSGEHDVPAGARHRAHWCGRCMGPQRHRDIRIASCWHALARFETQHDMVQPAVAHVPGVAGSRRLNSALGARPRPPHAPAACPHSADVFMPWGDHPGEMLFFPEGCLNISYCPDNAGFQLVVKQHGACTRGPACHQRPLVQTWSGGAGPDASRLNTACTACWPALTAARRVRGAPLLDVPPVQRHS